MRRLRFLLGFLILTPLAADDGANPDPLAPPEEGFLRGDVPEDLQHRIDEALAEGLAWLDTETVGALERYAGSPGHHAPGLISLRALTLSKCGGEPFRARIEGCLAFLREHHFDQDKFSQTYDVALNIMAIESYLHQFGADRSRSDNQKDLDWAARLAFWLASGNNEGGWTYSCPGYEPGRGGYNTGGGAPTTTRGTGRSSPFGRRPRNRPREEPADEGDARAVRFDRPPPIPEFKPVPVPNMQVQGRPVGRIYDNSNAQYAALGLKAATHLGIEFPASLWEDMAEHWLGDQVEEGPEVELVTERETGGVGTLSEDRTHARGWPYLQREGFNMTATASMTVAGIAALCVAGSETNDARLAARIEESLWDGWAWMQQNFLVESRGTTVSMHHMYYLYGLERAGVFSQVRIIGEHDWYVKGAEYLLSIRNADGSWGEDPAQQNAMMESHQGRHLNTCFALLFLKRASAGFLDPEYGVGSD